MSLIRVQNLSFEYPKKRILKNINFEIQNGSVTALVGPNGAGKTTLLRCLTSLETPMTGHVFFDNIDVHENPRTAHKKMGYLSDFFGVYNNLTVKQCLTYMAWCHKIRDSNLERHITELAEEVDLTKYLDEKASTLSRGYRQRLGVGMALVHRPKCVFLDEPASGMDPEARIKFSELMLRLKERGITIIVSSHILAELEDYCTDMLVIREGEIKSHVILKEHQNINETELHIKIQQLNDQHIELIKSYEGVSKVRISDNNIVLTYSGSQDKQADLLKFLVTKKLPVYQFTPVHKTLQSAYMDLAEIKKADLK